MPLSSVPSAPSAQTPSVANSQLAPKTDQQNDMDEMKRQMEADKQEQRNQQGLELDELINTVSNNIGQENKLDLQRNEKLDSSMIDISKALSDLMEI